jgi:peptidoglycan/xylan/chitin deacetylase (PgdA/CDA1 family)
MLKRRSWIPLRIPGLHRAKQLARSVWTWPRRANLVLLYHRVSNQNSDPWNLCVSPNHFAEHMEVLRSSGRSIVSLTELVHSAARWQHAVAITFDDGYADNLYSAAPVLRQGEAAATFFIISGQMGRPTEFWWDELDRLVFAADEVPSDVVLGVSGSEFRWQISTACGTQGVAQKCDWRGWHSPETERQRLFKALYQVMARMDATTREEALKCVRALWSDEGTARSTHRALNWQELRQLASNPQFEIGAHTVHHVSLANLDAQQQLEEIEGSKQTLEAQLGVTVRHFSYPYGSKSDYQTRTIRIVQNAGFASACVNFSGEVNGATDRYQLPRMYIEDWSGDEFARRLRLGSSRVHSIGCNSGSEGCS